MLRVFTIFSLAILIAVPGFSAEKQLYTAADHNLVRQWYKDITGKNISQQDFFRAQENLRYGSKDLDELRRSFVNSEDGQKKLNLIERLFWGYLARAPQKDEIKAIEDALRNVNHDLDKQIDDRITDWPPKQKNQFSGTNLVEDFKKCLSVEDVRYAITNSNEFLDHKIKELYKRYLKRDADNGGLENSRKNFRNRNQRVSIPEFFRALRGGFVCSDEGKRLYPDKLEKSYLQFRRCFPSDADRAKLRGKSDFDIDKELDCSNEAMRPRVEEVYRWIFGREVDKEGSDYWTGEVIKQQKQNYNVNKQFNVPLNENNDPILNLIQKFSKTPPDCTSPMVIAQASFFEELKGQEEINKTEADMPEELAEDEKNKTDIRIKFDEFVLREGSDKEIDKLLEDFNKANNQKGSAPKVDAKAIVISSAEFKGTEKVRIEAFNDLYRSLFLRSPEKAELESRKKMLNSGSISIEQLENEYMTSQPYKSELDKIQESVLKGEIPPFEVKDLSPDQAKFMTSLADQLTSVRFDLAAPYWNLLDREPSDQERDDFTNKANEAIKKLNIRLLPAGEITPDAMVKFRKEIEKKLGDLKKLPKSIFDDLQKQITGSKEFKDLARHRESQLEQLYQEILGRQGDAGGLKFYLDKLNSGEKNIAMIAAEFAASDEAKKYDESQKKSPDPDLQKKEKDDGVTSGTKEEDIKTLKDLKPFEQFSWANKVSIRDCKSKKEGNYEEYTGKATFFGLKDEDIFIVSTKDVYGVKCFIAGITFNRAWTPEDYYDGDKKDEVVKFLKILRLNGGSLIVSSSNVVLQSAQIPESFKNFIKPTYSTTYTEDFSLKLQLGLNLLGRLSLNEGSLKKTADTLKYPDKEVLLHGVLFPSMDKIKLRAYFKRINTPDWMPEATKTIQPYIEFTGKPALNMGVTLKVELDGAPKPLEFTGAIAIPANVNDSIVLMGKVSGFWENAFKINGFDIGDLAFKFAPQTNSFGVKGTVKVGTRVATIAGQSPLRPDKWGIRGRINELNLDDLIIVAQKMGGNVRHEDIPLPEIGLRDLELMVSSVDDQDLGLYEGVIVNGRLLFNGDDIATIKARTWKLLGKPCIEAKGQANPLDIGPLKLDGGKSDVGPSFDIGLSLASQHCKIAGRAELFGTGRELQIYFTKSKMLFEMTDKIFDAFQTTIKAEGSLNLKKPAIGVEASMKSDFMNKMVELTDKATKGKIPEVVIKHIKDSFEIKEAGFKGSLEDTMSGKVPGFWLKLKCLGKSYNITTIFNFKDAQKAAEDLAGDAGKRIIEKLEEFAKKIEEKVKEAVQKIKDAIVNACKKAVDKIKSWFSKNKKSSDDSEPKLDVRFIGNAVFYW